MIDDLLQEVTVVGAGGKMGQGIALLLLQEMAFLEKARLTLIDLRDDLSLKQYLRTHLTKYAEQRIIALRGHFAGNPSLVSNGEIIEAFVEGALDRVRFESELSQASRAKIVFEAALEDVEAKTKIFQTLRQICSSETLFLTNTSSIPISLLEKKAELEGRLAGFHFYNPPPVQKLVEVILPATPHPALHTVIPELAKRLKKSVVESRDVAGFIGNGHFMRELFFACQEVDRLAHERPLHEAIYFVNHVTKSFLLRPMGIFEVADYAGLEVCQNIAMIMNQGVMHPLIQKMAQAKQSFFKGDAVFSINDKRYHSFEAANGGVWKTLLKDPSREEKIRLHFQELSKQKIPGAELARRFLQASFQAAEKLVTTGVAASMEDVTTVLKLGFHHLYGLDDPCLEPLLQEAAS